MDRAAWGKHFKNNLKLVLCAAGIVAAVAILIAMRPIQSENSAGRVPVPAAASAHYAAGMSTLAQASPANQAASAANATGVSIAASSNLQNSQPGYTPPAAGNSSAPAVSSPVTPEPDPLYPIDPVPCKGYVEMSRIGCGICEAAPVDGSFTACWPRCPRGGVEMMCAYP